MTDINNNNNNNNNTENKDNQSEEETFVSTFPPPPPFYKLYRFYDQNNNNNNNNDNDNNNDEDVRVGEKRSRTSGSPQEENIKKEENENNIENNNNNNNNNDDEMMDDIIDEESLTMYYEPPPPPEPIEGVYHMFGGLFTTEYKIPTIEEEFERMQLFTSSQNGEEKIAQLKKLNKSLLFNFLELMKILINNPTAEIERETVEKIDTLQKKEDEGHKLAALAKLEQMELIMSNMGYLLNSYRPHQAYDQLIHILKEQIERKHNSVEELKLAFGKCRKILSNMRKSLENTVGDTVTDDEDVEMVSDQNISKEMIYSDMEDDHKPKIECVSIPDNVKELIQANLY